MGLLDDAIREHLELKRRAGADPGAIAHAEHEALDPIFLDGPAAADGGPEVFEAQEHTTADEAAGFSAGGQETAELDMSTVLEQDAPADEEFEWDAGAHSPEATPEEIPGQERLTFE